MIPKTSTTRAAGALVVTLGALAAVTAATFPEPRASDAADRAAISPAAVATLAPAPEGRVPAARAAAPPSIDLGDGPLAPPQDLAGPPYDGLFQFTRLRYGGGGGFGGFGRRGRRGGMWSHDYPRAERNFLQIIDETTYVRSQTEGSNVLTLDDPQIFNYPILYIVEVGYWDPTDEEVANLGEHLLKGGLLIVDDTRGERGFEWDNFAYHMQRALPGLNLVDLDHDHEVFDSFFGIDPLAVIPPYGPRDPRWYGIFEDNDRSKRLMVIFNFNNDIAEYWEFSERGYYPIDLANEAYKLGVNYVVYGLTH